MKHHQSPWKPEVEVIPHPGAPFSQKDDSDCEIVETPHALQAKEGLGKEKDGANKKDIGIMHPQDGWPSSKGGEEA